MILSPFGIVGWIVLIFVFFYLNGRINELTKRLDRGAPPRHDTAPAPSSPSSAPVSGWGVPPTSPPSPAVSGDTTQKKELGEEVGGRWLGKVGIVAIILGASFFLKWAFDSGLIGPAGRIILGAVGGVLLIGIGRYLHKKYLVYSDILSGGGIAILFLTVYAASQFYHFINIPVALFCSALVTFVAIALSVFGGTEHLAAVGVFGGFLTPFLFGFSGDQFQALMWYAFVVDLVVLGAAIFRKWNNLNVLGFLGTVVLFLSSYLQFYTPDRLGATFSFLTLFFAVYLIASMAHNLVWKKTSNGLDMALITFNAAAYAWMSYDLLDPAHHNIMGLFMLVLCVLYGVLSYVSYRANPDDAALNLYLPSISAIFLTLVMPLQFSGHWITLAWLLEAAALVSVAGKLRRHSMNLIGSIVYGIGLVRFFALDAFSVNLVQYHLVFNRQVFLGLVAIAVAYFIGYLFWRHRDEPDHAGRRQAAALFFVVAHLMTLFVLTTEITRYFGMQQLSLPPQATTPYYAYNPPNEVTGTLLQQQNTTVSIAWALYAFVLMAVGFSLKRRLVRILGLILFFVTALKVLIDVWQLGELYRIVSSICFGVLALIASFAYAKFHDRLKQIL